VIWTLVMRASAAGEVTNAPAAVSALAMAT